MKKIHIIVCIIITISNTVHSDSFTYEFCRFKCDDGGAYLELYIDLPYKSITYRSDPDGWYGALLFSSEIRRGDKAVANDQWIIEDFNDDPQNVRPNQRLVDVRTYRLGSGSYTFLITMRDSISGTQWQAEPSVVIKKFPSDTLSLSDIEIASHLVPADFQPKFSRGDFALIPNPRRIFGGEQPFLIYYIEVYLPGSPPATASGEVNGTLPSPLDSVGIEGGDKRQELTIERTVLNGIRDTVLTLPTVIRTANSDAFADVDSVLLDELTSGSYTLTIKVSDQHERSETQKKRFFIYQKDKPVEKFKPAIDVEEVDKELNEINFLLTRGQKKILKKMDPNQKAQFLSDFWVQYDDDPSTPEIPLRREFRGRVTKANEIWTTYRNPGHKTDRGRVFILYDEADHIERFPLAMDTKPYIIWTYDRLDGGAVFVFIDRSGLGEYELVHSTRRGEINNPSWFELYVKRSSVDTRR